MKTGLACKSREAATAALETIAGHMAPGTQREALDAVRAWIIDTTPPTMPTAEIRERLQKILDGTPEEQAGRAWVEREEAHPDYIAPEEGVEGTPFYHAG
jgi:hypothetical protein